MERAEVMNALRTHAVFPAAFEARVSKEAKAVILWLLQKDPAKRPTATGTCKLIITPMLYIRFSCNYDSCSGYSLLWLSCKLCYVLSFCAQCGYCILCHSI
jgi:hypothetical protein